MPIHFRDVLCLHPRQDVDVHLRIEFDFIGGPFRFLAVLLLLRLEYR